MPGPKTNEREGTRAVLRYALRQPLQIRQVIDAIRGKPVEEAADLLRFVERDAAIDRRRSCCVRPWPTPSNNDHHDPEELYVSACYVDEGPTAEALAPPCPGPGHADPETFSHVTIIVSRLPEERLARLQARRRAENLAMRQRRVEATRRARDRGGRRRPKSPGAPSPRNLPARRGRADHRRGVGDGARDGGVDVSRRGSR